MAALPPGRCEDILRPMAEWKKFEQGMAWMAKRWGELVAEGREPETDAEYQRLLTKFEVAVVEPLERRWQQIVNLYWQEDHPA